MFQLIIAVISIALLAALAAAAIFYGGTAYSESQIKSMHAEYANTAMQIKASMDLHKVDKLAYPSSSAATLAERSQEKIDELIAGTYMKYDPNGDWIIADDNSYISRSMMIQSEEACKKINKLVVGEALCPVCADSDPAAYPACAGA